jgi:hypothetical protein
MDGATTETVGWEPLEVLAACVLGAVTVTVLAGLVGGIVGATGSVPDELSQTFVGTVITSAAGWAVGGELFLLVALGIVWRQVQHWSARVDAVRVAGAGHLRRARRCSTWIGVLLLTAVAASTANLVGEVLGHAAPFDSFVWERYIVTGGTVVASVLIAGGGLWVVRYLTNRCWAAEDDRAEDDQAQGELDGDELEDSDR